MTEARPSLVVSLIAALDEGELIGDRGSLPWKHSEDMQYFRDTTTGHAVIMGRRTFQGLRRPLKDRLNIVLSRDPGFTAPEGVITARTADEALERAREGEVFVAGGAQVYEIFLPRADRLYLTRIPGVHAGDTRFPRVDWGRWRKVWERDGRDCRFERYERLAAEIP